MNKNIKLFNNWAVSGKDVSMQKNHANSVDEMFNILNKNNALDKPFTFLDIGCGNGWTVRHALKNNNCISAFGIDGSENMIKNAKSKHIGEFICQDIEDFNFDKKYDIIFSMETLYYIKDISSLINKIYQNLNDSGTAIIGIDHYKENKTTLSWGEDYNLDINTLTIKKWTKLFKNFKHVSHSLYGGRKDWMGTLIIYALK